jgi:acetylglutamate kinase
MIHEPGVVVHGGGVQITRLLERFAAKSEFVDGLRVTDETTLYLAALALVGEVHTHLVQSMLEAGLPAIGMFGALNARKKEGPWGFVGTSIPWIRWHHAEDWQVVVIPTLANGSHSLLNVNGDGRPLSQYSCMRTNSSF